MANACLFIGFSRPVSGKESEAFQLLMGEALSALEGFQKEGWFERYDVLGLTPHCGTLSGFILLQGERAKLDELRRTDAFERVSMRMSRVLDGFGVIPGVTLEGMRKVLQRNQDLFK